MDPNVVINIIDSNFETVLKCSCTEDDHYPLLNLTTKDQEKRSLGFMAYRVVKPPIDLEFNLMCCIELVSIKIWPRINSLKSTGFEIFVKENDVQSDYRKVGSHFNLKENGIQFMSKNFTEYNVSQEMGFASSPFYHSVQNQLRKVKKVKIVIKQTEKCVPVIKRLEILGTISKFASEKQRLSIQGTFQEIAKEKESSTVRNEVQQLFENSYPDRKAEIDVAANVPEIFLDAITYEIMSLPIVLPSGKTIDNSTLIKHNQQEEKWGRSASDPFTGQIYTDTRKPVLNDSLKVQIDAFLLKNSSNKEFGIVPRTVGTIRKRKLTELKDESLQKRTGIEYPDIHFKRRSNESSCNATSVSTSCGAIADVGSKTMDDLIRNVLNGRKYTTIPKKDNDSYPKCFQCVQQYRISCSHFYKISLCSHFICRYCLVELNLKICKCGQSFGNNDVIKYHGQMIW